MYVYLTKKILH